MADPTPRTCSTVTNPSPPRAFLRFHSAVSVSVRHSSVSVRHSSVSDVATGGRQARQDGCAGQEADGGVGSRPKATPTAPATTASELTPRGGARRSSATNATEPIRRPAPCRGDQRSRSRPPRLRPLAPGDVRTAPRWALFTSRGYPVLAVARVTVKIIGLPCTGASDAQESFFDPARVQRGRGEGPKR